MRNETKTIFVLITALILLLSLTTLSATENSNQTTQGTSDTNIQIESSFTDTQIQESNTNQEQETTQLSKNIKTSSQNITVNNYEDLVSTINSIKSDTNDNEYTINLDEGDYTVSSPITWGESIIKTLTINGNEQTINGNGNHFININNDYTLTITGLNINNCNISGNGGAIYNEGNLTLNNIQFNNNSGKYGGAIYNKGTLTINSTKFNNNLASTFGGVIYNNASNLKMDKIIIYSDLSSDYSGIYDLNGDVIINNLTITNCTTKNYGGIYTEKGRIKLTNSTISNNTGSKDIAVSNIEGNVFIDNCTFNYNSLISTPGLFYNTGNLTINNSQIINNIGRWQAVVLNSIYGNSTITNSILKNNSIITSNLSTFYGVVINVNSADLTLINNMMEDCTGSPSGALIFISSSIKGITTIISNNTINNCSTSNGIVQRGSVLYDITEGTTIIENNIINNTKAGYTGMGYGGILYIKSGNASINNNTFNNSLATFGGVLYNHFSNINFTNNKIYNSTSTRGGVIYNNAAYLNMTNNTFNNCTGGFGGIVFNNKYTLNSNNNIFNNNSGNQSAVFYNYNSGSIYSTNDVFNNNSALTGTIAYNTKSSTIIITNITANSNLAQNEYTNTLNVSYNGFVLFNEENATMNVTNSYFENNTDDTYDLLMNDNVSFVENNIYIDNMLNDSMVLESVESVDDGIKINLSLALREVYNDMVRNGTISVLLNNKTIEFTASVEDNSAVFTIPSEYIKDYENNITLNYALLDKSYQNITLETLAYFKLTPVITVNNETFTYGDTIIITGNISADVPVTVTINGKDYLATVKNGTFTATINDIINVGEYNVTVTTADTTNYTIGSCNGTLTVSKVLTNIIVNSVNGIIGENITLTATVTDSNGNLVNGGKVVIKINGLTLRDNNGTLSFSCTGSPYYLYVVNGKVNVTLIASINLRNSQNVTAVYSGNSIYEGSRSSVAQAQIRLRNATLNVSVTPNPAKQDTNITITVKLADITPNGTNTTAINDGYVYFKHNGHTLVDENNQTILVKVVDGTATTTCYIPVGTSSVLSDGKTLKDYNITVGYINNAFNPTELVTSSYNVEKSTIEINLIPVIYNSTKTMTITGNITDYNGNIITGSNKVCVKVNGITIKDSDNQPVYYYVTDGIIDIQVDNLPVCSSYTSVAIVSGQRQAYDGKTETTTNITVLN